MKHSIQSSDRRRKNTSQLGEDDHGIGSRRTLSRVDMLSRKEAMRDENPFEFDKEFLEAFMSLKSMVEELYREYKERTEGGDNSTSGKKVRYGCNPPKPPVYSNATFTLSHELCMANVPLLK